MKFEVNNRWNGSVIFEAEIAATEETPISTRLGFAIKKAFEAKVSLTRADLTGADLTDAVLTRAVLTGADLTGADMTGADLTRADMTGAVLRSFKSDLWMTLMQNPAEVGAVIAALKEGRVNGSPYEGDCACLVGTIANAKGCSYTALDHDSTHPAEAWFMMISPGDKPGDDTGGGFAAQKALEWCEEWQALNATRPIDPIPARDAV